LAPENRTPAADNRWYASSKSSTRMKNPTGELLADETGLMVTVRSCQKDARFRSDWPDDNPALRASVVRQGRRVFHYLEAKNIHEEADSRVVVPNEECYKLEIRHRWPDYS
jgi:hypothetical protein